MTMQRISAQIDEGLVERLKDVAAAEGKDPAELVALGLRTVLNMAPVARASLEEVEKSTTPLEQATIASAMSRAAIVARMEVLDARAIERYRARRAQDGSQDGPATEDQILEEAARMCEP